MMELKGSKTEKNLLKAFAGESQAINRYLFYAKTASEEGYLQISKACMDIAEQEKIHARRFYEYLPGGKCEITSEFPSGGIGITEENLKAAIDGEHEEHSELYPSFAQVAREEDFEEIARLFLNTAVAEQYHENRFKKLLKILQGNEIWKRDDTVKWTCAKCGFTLEANEPPGKCPVCDHPKEYFSVPDEEF